jgi:aminoglycoside 3-N-acetyltransferase
VTLRQRGQTRRSLAEDLRTLGVAAGQVLLVHSSLRSLGWVEGGAVTVVAALRDAIGVEGTLVVPTMTIDNSDTSRVHLDRIAGMTAEQVARFRDSMAPFDPDTSPSTGMGQIAEAVRTAPGSVRSAHPQTSFAALGPMAGELMEGHADNCHFGEQSPLAKLYEVGAWILLLGVGFTACTALHLAEYRYVSNPPRRTYRCVVKRHGRSRWWEYEDVVLDDRDIAALGAAIESIGIVATGPVGAAATCRLMPMVPAVEFAKGWLAEHRTAK